MSVVVTKNKFVYSVYFPEKKTLHTTYKGRPVKELIFEHLDGLRKHAKKHEILGSLIELRKVFGSYFKYIGLLTGDLYPKMKEAGLKVMAFVISDDILVKNITYKLVDEIEKMGLSVKIFTDFEGANEWLTSKVEQD